MTDIAREIAELMGEEYYFGPTGDYDPHSQPYLDDRDDLSRIEWWCRDRGVWIVPEYRVNGLCFRIGNVRDIASIFPSGDLHTGYQNALLAAVRIASEVEE